MPKADRKQQQVKFLAERLAILMVYCQSYSGDYLTWMREHLYTGDSGEELRSTADYRTALGAVRNMLRRHNDGCQK